MEIVLRLLDNENVMPIIQMLQHALKIRKLIHVYLQTVASYHVDAEE